MKLAMTTGCIADSLTVDGVEEINLSTPQRKRAMRNLASWYIKHPEHLNSLLQHTLELYGEEEYNEHPCSCCGDTITTYELEI